MTLERRLLISNVLMVFIPAVIAVALALLCAKIIQVWAFNGAELSQVFAGGQQPQVSWTQVKCAIVVMAVAVAALSAGGAFAAHKLLTPLLLGEIAQATEAAGAAGSGQSSGATGAAGSGQAAGMAQAASPGTAGLEDARKSTVPSANTPSNPTATPPVHKTEIPLDTSLGAPTLNAAYREVVVGDVRISPATRRVMVRDSEVNLRAKEFDLLLFMARNHGIVFTRDQLYELVWELDSLGESTTVAVHIKRLRDKLEVDSAHPQIIQTVRGAGYRLQ